MKIDPRHLARETAIQALYAWDLTHNSSDIISFCTLFSARPAEEMEVVEPPLNAPFVKMAGELFHGTITHVNQIDHLISAHISCTFSDLDLVEKAILRLGVFEITQLSTPTKVILNESVELAKTFGAADSYKFVNGVLDNIIINRIPHALQKN